MVKTYSTLSVIYPNFLLHGECRVGELSIQHFNCLGVEEYSYNESQVDELLGERSYSGGDLTADIFEEVEIDASGRNNPIVNFFFDNEQDAMGFQGWLNGLKLNIDSAIAQKPVEDWNAFWREHYDIIELFNGFRIVPSWKKEFGNLDKDIFIYPGMGFGTGNHETTFLCLMAMIEHKLPNNTVLDFGSGSGILGIGAKKLNNNAKLDFYDIDADAMDNCRENLLLNGLLPENHGLYLPEEREKLKPCDLVFANILKHVLIEESTSLKAYTKPDGHLILSGILTEQSQEVQREFIDQGFELIKEYKKGDWIALLLKRL